jgi:hypothetical protein
MRLSKKSWHYRLMKYYTSESNLVNGELANISLCDYFPKLVLTLFLSVTVYIISSPIFLLILLADYLPETKPPIKVKPKEPRTLFGKWLKAKKEKICPLIEWTE